MSGKTEKKIALIGPTYPFRGGISHYTTLLFRHLKKKQQVRFFSFIRQYPGFLFPGRSDIDRSSTILLEPDAERTIDSLNPVTWFRTAREIIRSDSDVLIIPWWVSFWAPQFSTILMHVKRYARTKILFICHNVVAHESRWIDRALTRKVLALGDFFIVHSEEDRHNLLSMLPDARVSKCFHPTYGVFHQGPSKDGADDIRQKYGLEGPVLLFFGFVRKYKGLGFLLNAMPEILETLPVHLVVAGEFWNDRAEYERLIEELGIGSRVVLVDDYIPNEAVGDYFAVADLVVQPYISATGSGVVQMAFGFSKPVVATAVGSLPEIVQDGKTGFLVPPGDSGAIANAVVRFFEEKRAETFKANIKQEQYRFSWEHMVDSIEAFLNN